MTKLHITFAQLLQEWRLRALPEPLNDESAGLTRLDGYNLDAIAEAKMKDWYHTLLNDAPLELQAPVDGTLLLTRLGDTTNDGCRYRLPAGFKHLVRLRPVGIPVDARILSGVAACTYNPMIRAVDGSPVAVVSDDTLTVYPAADIEEAIMVCDTGDGICHLDAAALATIKSLYP